MKLKDRLKTIASMVPECNTVCDIGTDHAYVPIYLALNKICRRVVATDIRQGPVLIAQKNIKENNLEGIIDVRLGSGLSPVKIEEIDVVVIAGMGGLMICDILAADIQKAKRANRIILQPMNAVEVVRKWLYLNGFDIISEVLAEEGNKIYTVIATKWTGNLVEKEEVYYYIGEKLIENKDPLLGKYVRRKILQLNRIISGLKKSEKMGAEIEKHKAFREKLHEILKKT